MLLISGYCRLKVINVGEKWRKLLHHTVLHQSLSGKHASKHPQRWLHCIHFHCWVYHSDYCKFHCYFIVWERRNHSLPRLTSWRPGGSASITEGKKIVVTIYICHFELGYGDIYYSHDVRLTLYVTYEWPLPAELLFSWSWSPWVCSWPVHELLACAQVAEVKKWSSQRGDNVRQGKFKNVRKQNESG